MIYDFPAATDPIRQGDIFVGLPRLDFSLLSVVVADDFGTSERNWDDVLNSGGDAEILAAVKAVSAIVITQDCDALRSNDITLAEIRDFRAVERKAKDCSAPSKWVSIITQQARINSKWFYLPPDPKVGFASKMAADFTITISIKRPDLQAYKHLRRGRLNDVADEHLRERLAEFFRRYPVNEWYPLDQAEFEAYCKGRDGVEPFPHQKLPSAAES